MKKMNYKVVFGVFVLLLLSFGFVMQSSIASEFVFKTNLVEDKIKEILKKNENKEIIANQNYQGKFVYLAFQWENDFISYFLDPKTGEEKEFYFVLKKGSQEKFLAKENELLNLKYPKFVVNALNHSDVVKNYQILDNAFVIYYSNVKTSPEIEESPMLRISFNEIKELLDFPVSLEAEYVSENGYLYDKNKKTVALTFDDGPSGEKTNRLVEILEQNKAHATFFMVGNRMESGASVIRNVLNKGNEIGSHSYAHKNMKRQKLEDIISEEEKTKEIYRNITGQELKYTRPPYGNITKNIKENLNTIFINWNLDTEDWLHRDKKYIVDYVMENVHDGAIILMHDTYESTIDAVEELLPKLYAAGYQVVSISELANLKGRVLEPHSLYRSLKEV